MGTYVAGQCTFFISVTDAFCLGETHDKRVIKCQSVASTSCFGGVLTENLTFFYVLEGY